MGFTLAEVIITLGIIGVVAALTIPNIVTSYKKKVAVERVKVTYSILSQAVNVAKNDYGDVSTWNTNLSNKDFAQTYLLPYLRSVRTISKQGAVHRVYTLSTQGGSLSVYLFWTWNQDTSPIYVLANGSIFVVGYAQNNIWVVVDINGLQGPNVMGIDGFSFNIDTATNQLIPTGFGRKREELINGNSSVTACIRDSNWQYYRGGSCAALLMSDGWTMKDDYPWGNGSTTPIK